MRFIFTTTGQLLTVLCQMGKIMYQVVMTYLVQLPTSTHPCITRAAGTRGVNGFTAKTPVHVHFRCLVYVGFFLRDT